MVKQRGGRLGINMAAVRGDYSGYHESNLAGICKNAYGSTLPVSHGTIHPNGLMTGPNMHVHPGSTGLQTGGYKRSKSKKMRSSKKSSKKSAKRTNKSKKSKRSKGN